MSSISKGTVTLKKLAEETGLSASAVSQILNNKPNDFSSEKTKQRVKDIARKYGYRQRFSDKLLRKERTRTVGLIISMPRVKYEEHIQDLILRVIDGFNKKGYITYLYVMKRNKKSNLALTHELVDRGVAHFVFIGSPCGYDAIETYILNEGLTLIGWDSDFSRNFNSDSVTGVEEMIRYYVSKGLTNFRMLISKNQDQRIESLQRVFPDTSLKKLYKKHIVELGDFYWLSEGFQDKAVALGYEATQRALKKDKNIQVLIYLSDFFAIGGVKYLYEHNYKIGKDIHVAGFNNINAVRNNVFPISSIEHDVNKISQLFFQEAFRSTPFQKNLKTKIIIRD